VAYFLDQSAYRAKLLLYLSSIIKTGSMCQSTTSPFVRRSWNVIHYLRQVYQLFSLQSATPISSRLINSASVFNLSQKLRGPPLARDRDDFEASTVEKFRHSRYASMAGSTRSLHDGAAQKAAVATTIVNRRQVGLTRPVN